MVYGGLAAVEITLFTKILNAISDPVNIVLLLWIWWFMRDRSDLLEINAKLLDAQEKRGVTLANITTLLDSRLPQAQGGAK